MRAEMETGSVSAHGPQPLGVGGLLAAAFNVYRRRAPTLFAVAAVAGVPAQVIASVVYALGLPGDVYARRGTLYSPAGQSQLPAGNGFALFVIEVIAVQLTTGLLSRSVADVYAGAPSGCRTALRFAGERVVPLLSASLLAAAAIVIGTALVFVPGIYALIVFSVTVPEAGRNRPRHATPLVATVGSAAQSRFPR